MNSIAPISQMSSLFAIICIISILLLMAALVAALTVIGSTCLSRQKGEFYPEKPEGES